MAKFLGLGEDELQLFLDETAEHLDTLETDLLELEAGGAAAERVARVFRAAHSIKGAAATVGLDGMARLTHAMETLLDHMRSDGLSPAPALVTALLTGVDVLRQMLAALVARRSPQEPPPDLLDVLERAGGGTGGVPEAPTGWDVGAAGPSGAMMVQVRLQADCAMPAVRALQVLLALEGLGEVLASDPSQAAIESEQVTEALRVWLDTDHGPAAVQHALEGIPELAAVEVQAAAPGAVEPAAPATAGAPASRGAPAAERESRPAAPHRGGEDRTIRVDVALLDTLMNLVGELVIDRGRLAGIGQSLSQGAGEADVAEELGRVNGHLARVTGALQEAVLKARMLPIERVFRKFPRMVRDLTQQLGKQVDFVMAGEETELDRSLLEVIGDPLLHLLRNALDHGLEPPAERQQAGKPPAGALRLTAGHEENHVVIEVRDDGRGIDPDRLRAAAVSKGLLTAERARELAESEAIGLLFAPGFSTADRVTDVSGRGVGLDVVRRNIERVGGRIEVHSQVGAGTNFRLLLPLTLATIRALLVKVGPETLALPLSTVAETLRVAPEQFSSVKGRWVTRVRGQIVPLLWLEQFLRPGFRPVRATQPAVAVLVNPKGDPIGLVVDRLLGEQEVVVKGLGVFFGQVRGVSGVTILGDGSLALIADVGGLVGILAGENTGDPGAAAQLTAVH